MVTQLKNQGQNSLSDQLRETLATSAASKFLQRSAPQQQVPDMDYVSGLFPLASTALQSGLQAYGDYSQNQQKQEQMQKQAQALAQQLQIPIEQAMQIMQAEPALQKQLIQQIQQEKEMAFKQQESATGFERQQAIESQKQQDRIDILGLKQDFESSKNEFTQIAKGLENEGQYKQSYAAAKNLFNIAKQSDKFDSKGLAGSPLVKKYWGTARTGEAQAIQEINKYIAAQAPILGLDADAKKTMKKAMLDQFYSSPQEREEMLRAMLESSNPANTDSIRTGIDQARQQMESGNQQQETSQAQDGMDFSQLPQGPQEQGWGEYAARKGSIIAANAPAIAGIPGDIANAGLNLAGKMGNVPVVGTGLPMGLLQNAENMDPEMLRELMDAQKNAQPGQTMPEMPQLPGSAAIKDVMKSILPKGYTEPQDAFDRVIEEASTQLPIIALAAATGGAGAAIMPAIRAVSSGVAVEGVDQLGGGEWSKFAARLGVGWGLNKLQHIAQDKKVVGKLTDDLEKIAGKIYDKVEQKGEGLKFNAQPFQQNLRNLEQKSFGTKSTVAKVDQESIKKLYEEYGFLGQTEHDSHSLTDLVKYSQSIGSKAAELETAKGRRFAFKIIEGIDKTLAQQGNNPLVQEYNIGRNIFKSTYQLNALEDGAKWLKNTKYAGIGSRLLNTFKYIAGGALDASGAVVRDAGYIMKHPEAQELLGEYLSNIGSGNVAGGRANLLAIAKIMQSSE